MVLNDQCEEVAQHLLGDVEVGNDAVLHWSHRDDAFGGAAEHALRLEADPFDLLRFAIESDYRRLVQYDAFSLYIDQCIGGAEVDGDCIRREEGARLPEWKSH